MKIEPTYVTFEQAKKLTEKGMFPLYSESFFDNKGKKHNVSYKQTPDGNEYSCFEQWQVIEWLRVVHGIWIAIETSKLGKFNCRISKKEASKLITIPFTFDVKIAFYDFNTPQEAYSASFDYTLNNLL